MAEQDSQGRTFWTSLPGILTGAAALITAVSGLAIWHHQAAPQPSPAPIVQQATTQQAAAPTVQPAAERQAGGPVPTQSKEWCEAKYQAWKDEKTKTGIDDAALRKQLTRAHCPQYGLILGPPK